MDLVIREPRMCGCDICVEVGDKDNLKEKGTVSIIFLHLGKTTSLSKEITLEYPLKIVKFENIPKTGNNTNVLATVKSGVHEKDSRPALVTLCSE